MAKEPVQCESVKRMERIANDNNWSGCYLAALWIFNISTKGMTYIFA